MDKVKKKSKEDLDAEDKLFEEIYEEYLLEGLPPKEARAKANRTIACFKGGE